MAVGRTIQNVIVSARCEQWTKNLFVFAAPIFSRQLFMVEPFVAALAAFVAFCCASSAVYLLNDVIDCQEDRLHPVKRLRPIAAGELAARVALSAAVVLGIIALALSIMLTTPATTGIIALYIAANLLYSRWLKHVVILDVMFIAAVFILRILAGACATAVTPSFWLLLCTLNVSLFLGFAKRRAELAILESDAANHRSVLQHYSQAFLDQMIAIVTSATLVCYILYTVDVRTVAYFGTHMLVISVPFVMYGLFRYLYLSYHKQEGGAPSKTVVMDKAFVVNIFLWGLICIAIIYGPDSFRNWLR